MAYPFIVVEGIDGAGKATQVEHIRKLAKRRRDRVFLHKFPTESAKKIHDHLDGKIKLSEDELFLEYSKDIQKIQGEIKRHLGLGWVICDRYAISTVAYQSVQKDIDERMEQIEKMKLQKPDTIIWIDLPVEVAMERKQKQKTPDVHEADKKFLQTVSENYEHLYESEFMCQNWIRVWGDEEQNIIAKEIRNALFED